MTPPMKKIFHWPRVTAHRDFLVIGKEKRVFPLVVPQGCSVQSGGDWAAHYNGDPRGTNDGTYTLVCVQKNSGCLAFGASAVPPVQNSTLPFGKKAKSFVTSSLLSRNDVCDSQTKPTK